MAAQRIVGVEHRPHSVGQLIAPLLAATMGDTVGKSGGQQRRDSVGVRLTAAHRQPFYQLLRPLLPVALLTGKRRAKIAIAAARRLFQDRRQLSRRGGAIGILRRGQHRRQTRIVAQRRHFAPVRRQPLAFQRRKVGEQTPGRRQINRRRQIQPAKLRRVLASPLQQLQQQ